MKSKSDRGLVLGGLWAVGVLMGSNLLDELFQQQLGDSSVPKTASVSDHLPHNAALFIQAEECLGGQP